MPVCQGFCQSQFLTVKMADKNGNITDTDAEADAEADAVDVNVNVEAGSEPDMASIERIYRYAPPNNPKVQI